MNAISTIPDLTRFENRAKYIVRFPDLARFLNRITGVFLRKKNSYTYVKKEDFENGVWDLLF